MWYLRYRSIIRLYKISFFQINYSYKKLFFKSSYLFTLYFLHTYMNQVLVFNTFNDNGETPNVPNTITSIMYEMKCTYLTCITIINSSSCNNKLL